MMNVIHSQLKAFWADEQGQGMTEYIIIVALIAIAAIGVITLFGQNIAGLFGLSADALTGQDNLQTSDYTKQSTQEQRTKTMANFGTNNAP
jgi:pilus assembly protein Flp/PilA